MHGDRWAAQYFPKITDQLRYYSTDKVLFRFVKQP